MTTTIILIAAITFLLGTLSTLALLSVLLRLDRRLSALEQTEEERKRVLLDARGRERSHHAYNTLAAIEDATALLIDAELDLEAIRARQETALGILRILRKGPNSYNKNKE